MICTLDSRYCYLKIDELIDTIAETAIFNDNDNIAKVAQ